MSTFLECVIASICGGVAGFIVNRIISWLKPGDWRLVHEPKEKK